MTTPENKQITTPPIIIFDMDGTLYRLDGQDGGFTNSTLNQAVLFNTQKLIISRESCGISQAQELVQQGIQDQVGLSNFLAKRYNCTRPDILNTTWNIDPEGIIREYDTSVRVVTALSREKALILLTSAPAVWQEKVFGYLALGGRFSAIWTGEQFGQKDEVFRNLAEELDPTALMSVGDQLKTDIIPAQELGIRTLLVRQPQDLEQLLI